MSIMLTMLLHICGVFAAAGQVFIGSNGNGGTVVFFGAEGSVMLDSEQDTRHQLFSRCAVRASSVRLKGPTLQRIVKKITCAVLHLQVRMLLDNVFKQEPQRYVLIER